MYLFLCTFAGLLRDHLRPLLSTDVFGGEQSDAILRSANKAKQQRDNATMGIHDRRSNPSLGLRARAACCCCTCGAGCPIGPIFACPAAITTKKLG
eukprot:6032573-Amphidinium_carterae.1